MGDSFQLAQDPKWISLGRVTCEQFLQGLPRIVRFGTAHEVTVVEPSS